MLFRKKPIELLQNCAFCKGVPMFTYCGDHKQFLVYRCSQCHKTPVRMYEAKLSEKQARRVWNKRTGEAVYVLMLYHTSKVKESEEENK